MNAAKKLIQLGQLGARRISVSQGRMASEKRVANYANLKAKQEKFQIDDGRPVHIKGGILDSALYQLTMALSALGVALSLKVIYDLSYPKKA